MSEEESQARFEEIEIPLPDRIHDLDAVTGILGVPEWWPTGSRIAVVFAQGSAAEDPVIEEVQRQLTERRYLTLRFPMPYMQAGKRKPDDMRVMRRTYQAAVAMLSRDPTAAPAHIFIGGRNQGALVAAHSAIDGRMRVEGVFFMGYPLHKQDQTEDVRADTLYRVINPMLFFQGNRDRHCDLPTLRQALGRVGAPVQLHVIDEADHLFRVPKKSGRTPEQVNAEVLTTLEAWMLKTLGENA